MQKLYGNTKSIGAQCRSVRSLPRIKLSQAAKTI
jgi:hypothetical protein